MTTTDTPDTTPTPDPMNPTDAEYAAAERIGMTWAGMIMTPATVPVDDDDDTPPTTGPTMAIAMAIDDLIDIRASVVDGDIRSRLSGVIHDLCHPHAR